MAMGLLSSKVMKKKAPTQIADRSEAPNREPNWIHRDRKLRKYVAFMSNQKCLPNMFEISRFSLFVRPAQEGSRLHGSTLFEFSRGPKS